MPVFDLDRIQIDVELPLSLNNCNQRLEKLKEEYASLQETRKYYNSYKDYWRAIGGKIQRLNAEIQILNNWKKQMNALLDKELGKKVIAANPNLNSPDGIICALYDLIQTRFSYERPIRQDEKPAMLAAMHWLREWRSIAIAPEIEPRTLGNKLKVQPPKTKRPRKIKR